MRRARAAARTAVVLAALALAAGCGVPASSNAHFVDDADVPYGLLSGSSTTAPPPSTTAPVGTAQVCFEQDGKVTVVARPLAEPGAGSDLASLLRLQPSEQQQAAGLRSVLSPDDPTDRLVAGVTSSRGLATVDLTPAFAQSGASDQLLALAQVVCTLTAQPGIGQVTFTLAGKSVFVPRADGAVTDGPVTREDYRELIGGS